jgi:hypothetical protein
MVAREINGQIGGLESEIDTLGKKWNEKAAYFYDDAASDFVVTGKKLPSTDCKRIIELQQILSMLPQKKKKESEKEIAELKSKYPTFEKDLLEYKEFTEISRSLQYEKDNLLYKTEYIRNRVDDCLYVLEKYGLVERKYSSEILPPIEPMPEIPVEYYLLTNKGLLSTNLAEIHPLIGSFILDKIQLLSIEQIIQLFICFTDIRVPEDNKILHCSMSDLALKDIIKNTEVFINELETLEFDLGMNTGIRYESVLNFDFTDDILGWINAETEEDCKYFIQTVVYGKEISVGDFTKAILKVSNITREFSCIAENSGNIEFLHNLSQIDGQILKYVTTAQSLYV